MTAIYEDVLAPYRRPLQGDASPDVVDARPEWREKIAQQIYLCSAQNDIAWRALEIADDHAVQYHVRRAAEHMRKIVDGANFLKRVNARAKASEGPTEGSPNGA